MKSVGMAYVEAVKLLKGEGHRFQRAVHITFVPDEEIGGRDGMEALLSDRGGLFDALNVGFCLDEGLAPPLCSVRAAAAGADLALGIPSPTPSMLLFKGERSPWCRARSFPFGAWPHLSSLRLTLSAARDPPGGKRVRRPRECPLAGHGHGEAPCSAWRRRGLSQVPTGAARGVGQSDQGRWQVYQR